MKVAQYCFEPYGPNLEYCRAAGRAGFVVRKRGDQATKLARVSEWEGRLSVGHGKLEESAGSHRLMSIVITRIGFDA